MPKKTEAKPAKEAKTTKKATAKKEGETKPKKEAKPKKDFKGLKPNQVKVLNALPDGKPMTRKELIEATGIQKGYSKLIGRLNGESDLESLVGRKLVKVEKPEEGPSTYQLLAAGKKMRQSLPSLED